MAFLKGKVGKFFKKKTFKGNNGAGNALEIGIEMLPFVPNIISKYN